jgi:hypothetical protein
MPPISNYVIYRLQLAKNNLQVRSSYAALSSNRIPFPDRGLLECLCDGLPGLLAARASALLPHCCAGHHSVEQYRRHRGDGLLIQQLQRPRADIRGLPPAPVPQLQHADRAAAKCVGREVRRWVNASNSRAWALSQLPGMHDMLGDVLQASTPTTPA